MSIKMFQIQVYSTVLTNFLFHFRLVLWCWASVISSSGKIHNSLFPNFLFSFNNNFRPFSTEKKSLWNWWNEYYYKREKPDVCSFITKLSFVCMYICMLYSEICPYNHQLIRNHCIMYYCTVFRLIYFYLSHYTFNH